MNDQNLPLNDETSNKAARFHQRAASSNWEPIPLSGSLDPACIFWAWFKPQGVQNQLTITIPVETFQKFSSDNHLTLLRLLNAIPLEVSQLARVSLFGTPVEISCQDHPAIHQPILQPAAGIDPHIHFILATEPTTGLSHVAESNNTGNDERVKNLRRAIDLDWNAVRGMETQLKILRKQLVSLLTRLNTLNRDLNPEETLHSDSLDLREWQDARRWLRDMSSKLTRYLKEYDIGMTSSAGNRHRLSQIYQQFIVTGLPLEGIEQIQHEFEAYRRMAHNLMQGMSSSHATAKIEGEQRAQQVLRKIAVKTRAARVRKK